MKIAHICPQIRHGGGTETFVREVNRTINQLGIESAIYSTDVNPSPALLSSIGISILLGKKALREGSNALIFHRGQGASLSFRRAKTTCYFHHIKYDDLANGSFVRRIYRATLAGIERHLVRVVCNSVYAASRLRRLMPKADVKVVYPGSRRGFAQHQPDEQREFCYYHSRIHPRKNQDFLLSVFDGLPYNLCLTGGTWDTQARQYQRKVILRVQQMKNVKIVTDINNDLHLDLLSRCSLFLFPAMMEPFGMVTLDAMAFGKPIIALDSGATREVITDAGVFCTESVDNWRGAIRMALSNPLTRQVLSKNGLARAKEFSWEKTAKELIGIIESR